MSLLHKLFVGRLGRKGFWITLLSSQLVLHVVVILLTFTVYEGNAFSNVYYSKPSYLLDNLFPDLKIAILWPITLLTWFLVTLVSTGAFARRLEDIKMSKSLALAFPITAVWLTFFGFQSFGGTLFNFNEESTSFFILVILIYTASFFTLVVSLFPTRK